MTSHDSIPTNVNDLTTLVITQRGQLAHQSLFIDQLLEQIKLANHHRFGVKSEHISTDQLHLLLGDEQKANTDTVNIDDELTDPAPVAINKTARRGRRRLPGERNWIASLHKCA